MFADPFTAMLALGGGIAAIYFLAAIRAALR